MEHPVQTPVTILTGFLGSGKTTLLNRILKENHGHRIAVIENEFGEAGIDNELLVQESNEKIVDEQPLHLLHRARRPGAHSGRAAGEEDRRRAALRPRDHREHTNLRARIGEARHGQASIGDLLDIRGFNPNATLEIEPDFLADVDHEHDDDVTSFVFREDHPLDLDRVEDFLSGVIQVYGTKLMGYKGVVNIMGMKQRVVLQGVHMLMGSDAGAAWKLGEKRESRMVFIGRDMPKDVLLDGLAQCVAANA